MNNNLAIHFSKSSGYGSCASDTESIDIFINRFRKF